MRIQEVKKKRYTLSQPEISAIREVLRLLSDIIDDDELTNTIQNEVHVDIADAEDILTTIIEFNETDLDLR